MSSNAPQVAGQQYNVTPVLQAQDGSFVGTAVLAYDEHGNPTQYDMVAFDQGGNVRWIVPNDQPLIATDDGGVIGQSGTTYDQNGNATGQMANVPTQSWRGNIYQYGSVDSILGPALNIAMSLWAYLGGSPSSGGTAGRPWLFKLVWQNQFDFIPDVPVQLLPLKTDITADATIIKAAALKAFRDAYSQWPVTVTEGKPNTGDHQAVVQTFGVPSGSSTETCGNTDNNNFLTSDVYYECVMEDAQLALQVVIKNTKDESNALKPKPASATRSSPSAHKKSAPPAPAKPSP